MRCTRAILVVGLTVLAVRPAQGESALLLATDAIQPHVAVDKDGHIYATFLHQGNVAVAVSTDKGKSFGAPVIAIDVKGRARGGRQRGPRIGVDARQHVTVTCPVTFDDAEYQKKYPTAELYLAASKDGGKTWGQPVRVNETAKKAPEALHWMAVAQDGAVHVAWLDMRSRMERGQDVYYAKVVDGKVGQNIKIASTVCECCAPGLAVDAAGNPLVAYREGGDKPSREVFVTYSADQGAAFTKPVRVNRVPTKEDG